jgi:hypothetical protein
LKLLYGKILRELKQIPETSVYRKNTEDIVNTRLGHVENVHIHWINQQMNKSIFLLFSSQESNIARLERKINCGQIEEVIVQVSFLPISI